MLMRVSSIEAYRRWLKDEETSLEDFISFLTIDRPSDAMKAGTAFHKALEKSQEDVFDSLSVDGYRFVFDIDCAIALPPIRELRAYKDYGPLTVTGQVDCMDGLVVYDHKTTARFDPERYIEGCSWKFYLDIFGAKRFRWNVFEMREIDPEDDVRVYSVFGHHTLEQCAYPSMHDDCMRLACDLFDFASIHVPERRQAA